MSASDTPQPISELVYRLRALGRACAVLHVGAHPDDEEAGLVAYLARKVGVRVVYWSATRGEGGQNRIGPYRDDALGVYRTWESMAARAVDGGEALFGPFRDFGFSKNGEDSLRKWGGRTSVVREIVRAIRVVQPHVVIARWTGTPADGHGHHQAIGAATLEAFEAAGDLRQFPELAALGLPAWQPQKLYQSTEGDWQPGEDATFGRLDPRWERDGVTRVNLGTFDPVAGQTFQEQASVAWNKHQTQAMGFVPEAGDYLCYLVLRGSRVPVSPREAEVVDGLDPSLIGLADYPGGGSISLRTRLAAIQTLADRALDEFRPHEPRAAAGPLLEAVSALRDLRARLTDEHGETRRPLDRYLERKVRDFEAVAAQCLGLRLDCQADAARVVPGQQFRVAARLWNHRGIALARATFVLRLPPGWESRPLPPEDGPPAGAAATFEVTGAAEAELSCAYWLRRAHGGYWYEWPAEPFCGLPFGPPVVQAECRIMCDGHPLVVRQPAVHRESFAGGCRDFPVMVVPPLSLHPRTGRATFPTGPEPHRLELEVLVRRHIRAPEVHADLRLAAPAGWQVEPEHLDVSFSPTAAEKSFRFTVTIPGGLPDGRHALEFSARFQGREYGMILDTVRMSAPGLSGASDEATCIKEEFLTAPAAVDVRLIDVKFAHNLRYGYVKGAEEDVAEALARCNVPFEMLADEDICFRDLSQLDAIVIGPNAYLMRRELQNNAWRFLEYVERGGTLVVQYQGYGYQAAGLAPYPFRYHQPHDRVTQEQAPVTILDPLHLVFRQPNAIAEEDFAGWVHDRGMYFFGDWDRRYQPLLACNDPGEESRRGGFLAASYGRGTYLYTAYSLYRQLSAGVPGAFRLFANLLGMPAARTLERAALLRNVSLFSPLTEDQREAVARIMTERRVDDGIYLCHEHDKGDELYILASGEVDILKEIGGQEQCIAVAGKGDCIGELAVLVNIPRTASMRARGVVDVLAIGGKDFVALMREHPDMSARVIELLAGKLAATQR